MANGSQDDDRISVAVLGWLLAISASFLIGFLLLTFALAVSGPTWGVGTVVNVSWAVAIGVYCGWTRQGLQALAAAVLGAIVTILGLDLLLLVPTPAESAHFGLLGMTAFDSIAVLVALIGMSVLIGGGALIGVMIHLTLSRTGCLARIKNSLHSQTRVVSRRPSRFDPMSRFGLSETGNQLSHVLVIHNPRDFVPGWEW